MKGEKQIDEIPSEIENRIYHNQEGNPGSFMGNQHISNEKKFHERKRQQENRFLKEVLERIKDNDELYILGPAEMKTKLRQKIVTAEPGIMITVEPAEAMSIPALVAKIKEFAQSRILCYYFLLVGLWNRRKRCYRK